MRARVVARLLVVAAVAVILVVRGGDGDTYTLRMRLADAGGLKTGSPVVVGGVPVGSVRLAVERHHVAVSLRIEKKYAPVGKDVTAAVIAQNLLGQKQVRITIGDRRDAAPDGFLLPAAQVSPTTDLDQLLATLDPDTRTRLAIALNEAGQALTGRRMDLAAALRDFAPAMRHGRVLLDRLMVDNRALGTLVTTSDRLVGTLTQDRRQLGRALDAVSQTTATVAARREALGETLRRAPAALASARSFLAELGATAAPLGATARQLATAAPLLGTVLDRLPAFERAASPTLATAVRRAPDLTRLGRRATPTLRAAAPVVAGVRRLSSDTLPGVGSTLDGSMDNSLALLENWSRAIQFSDGLSHIFRGEASFAPDVFLSAIKRLTPKSRSHPDHERRPGKGTGQQAPSEPRPSSGAVPKLPALPKVPALPDLLDAGRKKLLDQHSGGEQPAPAEPLLDYLLGNGR